MLSLASIMREQEHHTHLHAPQAKQESGESSSDAPTSPQHEETTIQVTDDTNGNNRNSRRRRRSTTKVIRRTTKINHEVYARPGERINFLYLRTLKYINDNKLVWFYRTSQTSMVIRIILRSNNIHNMYIPPLLSILHLSNLHMDTYLGTIFQRKNVMEYIHLMAIQFGNYGTFGYNG